MALVIIGTGLAGYNLAREWRKLNPEKALVIIIKTLIWGTIGS